MDKNENIELINDDGFGAASTQYLWRFSEYHGKLVIGTFDIATLASGFTQLTDGSLLEMTPEEFAQKMTYVKELLQSLKKTPSGAALTAVIIPGLSEPPVRTLRATIPENESHIFR